MKNHLNFDQYINFIKFKQIPNKQINTISQLIN